MYMWNVHQLTTTVSAGYCPHTHIAVCPVALQPSGARYPRIITPTKLITSNEIALANSLVQHDIFM